VSAKAFVVFCSFTIASTLFPKGAAAEKILAHDGDFTVFSDGRAGAFASYLHGDPFPSPPLTTMALPGGDGGTQATSNGQTIDSLRIRSGLIGNTFGFGVRAPVTEWTTAKAYIQVWAWVENQGQDRGQLNTADVRQGYVKLEGPWGSLLVGRSRGLFSRGNTDNDLLYAHGYGVGYPGAAGVDSNGPTQGQVGFGILGSWFASGIVYGTPVLGMKDGLTAQLNIGAFDPAQAYGAWTRTKWARPEAELTLEYPFVSSGVKFGKVVAFASVLYQTLYQGGTPDSLSTSAKGIAYGGRLELGPVRLGVSGHYGRGLGLYNALESSAAAASPENELRWIDGYSVLAMVVVGNVDVSAGWGITRVFLSTDDKLLVPGTNYSNFDLIKYQQGFSGGAVYHVKPWLHIDVDLFRADFKWFYGEKQVDYVANSGMLFTW
jgi:hypothetical protein